MRPWPPWPGLLPPLPLQAEPQALGLQGVHFLQNLRQGLALLIHVARAGKEDLKEFQGILFRGRCHHSNVLWGLPRRV